MRPGKNFGLVVTVWAALGILYGLLAPSGEGQTISERAAALHKDAIVLDGHVHITTATFHQNYDAWQVQETGNWDYARAKQGGLDVVVEQLYIEDRYNAYNYSVKQTVRLIEQFLQTIDANKDKMELALTSADVRRIVKSGKMAAIMALEGGFDMEGDLDVLRLFYRLGVRAIQLTNHDTTNAMADAWTGEKKWNGISDKGREVIREMNRLGIIVDSSHGSAETQIQAAEYSLAPIMDSHGQLGYFATRDRVVTDAMMEAFAKNGAYIFVEEKGGSAHGKTDRYQKWEAAQPPRPPRPEQGPLFRTPWEDYGVYIAALDAEMHHAWRTGAYGTPWREHAVKEIESGTPMATDEEWAQTVVWSNQQLGGRRTGIGFDLMGGTDGGLRMFDATQYPRLTEAMLKIGMPEEEIRGVLGENFLRLMDEVVAVAAKMARTSP